MSNLVSKFIADESGATAIEYGLIAAAMAVVIVAVMTTLSTSLKSVFTTISTDLTTGS